MKTRGKSILAACVIIFLSCNAATIGDEYVQLNDGVRVNVRRDKKDKEYDDIIKKFIEPLLISVQNGDRVFFQVLAKNNPRKGFVYWPWWSGGDMVEEDFSEAMDAVADDFMTRSIHYKDFNLRKQIEKKGKIGVRIYTKDSMREVRILFDRLCYQMMFNKNDKEEYYIYYYAIQIATNQGQPNFQFYTNPKLRFKPRR